MEKTLPVVELPEAVEVINIGLPLFEDAIRDQGGTVIGVDWRIPGGGEPEVVAALERLLGADDGAIEAANAEVLRRLDEGVPMLVDVVRAGDVVPDMDEHTILHSGPALDFDELPNPLQRSIHAAVVSAGWAGDVDEANRHLRSGDYRLRPANEHSTVVPMASAMGPDDPVYVVTDEHSGLTTHAPLNQGSGSVPWFGADDEAAVERLRFLRDAVGPVVGEAIRAKGPIDILSLAGQGIPMGDDVHMRTQATTNLLLRDLLPHLVASSNERAAEVATFLSANHLMFLNVAMAAAKNLTSWAGEVEGSSIVTTMARNGTTYGIRLPGHDTWFLTDAPPVRDALFYPGQGPETAANDIGDSAVLELMGLGGAAAANSPAVAGFLGGRMADAIAATRDMQRICAGESSRFRLPILDNVGTPIGVDVRRVVETGITPAVNTGIIHVSDGSGQIGAGVARAPLACFTEALLDLDRRSSGG